MSKEKGGYSREKFEQVDEQLAEARSKLGSDSSVTDLNHIVGIEESKNNLLEEAHEEALEDNQEFNEKKEKEKYELRASRIQKNAKELLDYYKELRKTKNPEEANDEFMDYLTDIAEAIHSVMHLGHPAESFDNLTKITDDDFDIAILYVAQDHKSDQPGAKNDWSLMTRYTDAHVIPWKYLSTIYRKRLDKTSKNND